MRKLTITLILILGFFSCSNPTSNRNGERSNLPDTTGYFAARNMRGLGSFKIGESTYSEILIIIKDEIRKDNKRSKATNFKEMPRYSEYQEKYLDYKFDKKGNIASQFYREDFGSIYKEIKYDTISSYLKEDILNREIFGSPNIRELEMFEYYIGDIEISSLKLKFYKDTLCQISCSQNDKIEEGFKTKYGNGKSFNNDLWKTPSGETKERPSDDIMKKCQLLKIDQKEIWENEFIKTESQTYCEYKYDGDKYEGASYSNSYFKMILKNKRIEKEIKDCDDKAFAAKKRLEEQNKQKDINKL